MGRGGGDQQITWLPEHSKKGRPVHDCTGMHMKTAKTTMADRSQTKMKLKHHIKPYHPPTTNSPSTPVRAQPQDDLKHQ